MSELKVCPKCKNLAKRITKGVCHNCYRRLIWNPPKKICKRCGRERPIQAWGLCNGCYNSVFHINKVKSYNRRLHHNISDELYRKKTSKCTICGFDKVVDLHHIDHNHKNNSDTNLIGLCPNHHRMIHDRNFSKDVLNILSQMGFKVPEQYIEDKILKENLVGTIHKNRYVKPI